MLKFNIGGYFRILLLKNNRKIVLTALAVIFTTVSYEVIKVDALYCPYTSKQIYIIKEIKK